MGGNDEYSNTRRLLRHFVRLFLGYDGYCCSVLIAHRPHGAGAIHFFDDGRHDRRSFRHFYCYQADKRNVFQFFLFGVLVLLTQVSFYVCVKYSNAETAAVIAATRPFCIMGLLLFAAVMPTASQILCCALALVGVCLMMTKGDFSTLSFGWLTLLVGFGAPLFSAAYTIQSRSIVRKVGPLIAMTWAMLFTTILCNLYYPFWKVSLEWNFLTSLSVLWVAIMGHIVAYTLYIVSASKILPTITGVLETIEPLTAIVLVAVVILGFSKPREKAN